MPILQPPVTSDLLSVYQVAYSRYFTHVDSSLSFCAWLISVGVSSIYDACHSMRQNFIPLIVCIDHILCIPLMMDVRVVSIFWLL
jgi:hypothetical protein